jgi:acyl-CoA synthetase (NDP forming)
VSSKLSPILTPSSVAVIGAGRDPSSMGGRLYRNLRDRFRGPVYPVNPRTRAIDSAPAFASVLDVPAPVDLAFVVVPAVSVLDVVRQCVQKHVRGLVVITGGYSETGRLGDDRQRELHQLVRTAGIPMVGPNCFGVVNTDPGVGLWGIPSSAEVRGGNIAFGSQSGALGVVIPDLIQRWKLGLSSFVSIGNKADVGENDLLLHWEHDPSTRVIALYLESLQDPRGFLEGAGRISRTKPIVVLKAGRTGAGTRAASSHTAALASQDAASEAVFRQAGVIRAETLEELFDSVALLSSQPVPAGRRVAVLGNASGPAVLCADTCESGGLTLPVLSPDLQESLRATLTPEASVHNPVDLIATIDPELYRASLGLLLASDEVDAVITIFVPRESGATPSVVRGIREVVGAAGASKPVLGVFMQTAPVPEAIVEPGVPIPTYLFPEAAARALARATRYGDWLRTPAGTIAHLPEIDTDRARRIVLSALERAPAGGVWLEPAAVQQLLISVGLSVPRWLVAHSPAEAAAAARWESPVVVKVIAPSVLHKTEAGGVLVDLRGQEQIRDGYRRVIEAAADSRGALVQEYVRGAEEVFIGVNRDPAFGPLIGCGLGGTLVELAGDVSFRVHPLTDRDAAELVASGRVARILGGYRGRPPADRRALIDVLLRVSALVEAVPEVVELDLNPVLVLPSSRGALAADARIRIASTTVPGTSAQSKDERCTGIAPREPESGCLAGMGAI